MRSRARISARKPATHIELVTQLTVYVKSRAVESESEGILGGVGVGKNVPTLTPTPTSIINLN
jgi:hypothetical protein